MEVNFPPCKEIMTDRTKRPTGAADGQDRRLGKFDFQLGKQKNNNCARKLKNLPVDVSIKPVSRLLLF